VPTTNPIELAAQIVMAFVSNNSVPRSELTALFETVHTAVRKLADGEVAAPDVETPTPAVSIRKSVTPDYLICLDDGKRFKSLRRHLNVLGMTPERYREKWNLPADYPMVAANYAAQRSELAKKIGLGQNRRKVVAAPSEPTPTVAKRKGGRARKASAEPTVF
jgi:predicted transcriptional regulator